MSMFKCLTLVLGITVCVFNEVAYLTVTAQEVPSSCSEIFRYQTLRNGTWYGPHAILPFITNSHELTLEFYVEQPVKDKHEVGILELYTNPILTTKDVRYFNPIQFALMFPQWFTNPLYISSIRLNGNLMCNSNISHDPKTHTTIKLQKNDKEMCRSGNSPTLPPPEYEECGRKQTSKHLIENNYNLTIEEYPWFVAIYTKIKTSNNFHCGGTLVSRKHVLTGAYCVIGQSPDKFTVVLGRTFIKDLFATGVIRKVNRIEKHPDYVNKQADADLAILFLNEEVTFSETVRAACIWPSETSIDSIIGKRGNVVGWGQLAEYPRRVFLSVVSQEDCLRSNQNFISVTSNRTICAGSRDGPGSCKGYKGSGFYFEYNNATFIRGVMSLVVFGDGGTCDLSSYVIFTDVAKHYDWIQKNLLDTAIPNSREL